jgi:predicted neuraminidase
VGHHDKAAVSISSDNSESVLIRDIPADAPCVAK